MSDEIPQVHIWSDGSCEPNPGYGGWATLLLYYKPGQSKPFGKWLSGGAVESTNNRMEIMGVLAGLRAVLKPANITIYTDSQYLVNGIGGWANGEPVPPLGWLGKWVKNGWKRESRSAKDKSVKNQDLWEEVHRLLQTHIKIRANWVRGHNNHPINEECDRRANLAREQIINEST